LARHKERTLLAHILAGFLKAAEQSFERLATFRMIRADLIQPDGTLCDR